MQKSNEVKHGDTYVYVYRSGNNVVGSTKAQRFLTCLVLNLSARRKPVAR